MNGPGRPPQARRLDLVLALRQSVDAFWQDFAPIILSGFALIVLPGLLGHMLMPDAPLQNPEELNSGLAIVLQSLSGIAGMLFVAIVTFGTLARLRGQPLPLAAYVRGGFAAAQPGMVAALLIFSVVMLTMSVQLAFSGSSLGRLMGLALTTSVLLIVVVWSVAIPAAIAERLSPLRALQRSADLTRGNRGRIFALFLSVGFVVLPVLMLLTSVVFGTNIEPKAALETAAKWSFISPGLWLMQLATLLVSALLAPLPAVLYAQLVRARTDRTI